MLNPETLTLVAVFCIVIVLAAGVLGMMQYRSAITPLRRLATAARAMAGGRFDALVPVSGDAEFADLAADFNRMATELRTLYQDLERKVAAQSRELVRSERLASVGYLAAGVAHEINNPLSIITGYGERAIQQLERGGESEITVKHLRIMCEEAYRCKAITDKLLSLARPGEEKRTSVELSKLAREVIALAEGLPDHAGQTITLEAGGDAMVLASADELKQVLLNLILNAFDASEGFSGHVAVRVEGSNGTAALSVTDQGRGMDAQTIERVFEPFFTDKRGSQQAGTGLGLSISHAIIMSHGGRLTAASDGPGCGSRFTIELPVST